MPANNSSEANSSAKKYWAILPAAGVGSRMQADRPKQYLSISVADQQKLVIQHTLDRLLEYPLFEKIVVVVSKTDPYWAELDYRDNDKIIVADGGKERCDSVLNGLNALADLASDNDVVAVHDIARPCITHQDLDKLFSELNSSASVGAILANPVRDTMKRGVINTNSSKNVIDHTVEREQLWHALTPQVFSYALLKQAMEEALSANHSVTDEASAVEYLNHQPLLVEGRSDNIKITRPQDLQLAELFLNQQINQQASEK